MKPKYPNVICEEHPGQVEPGYVICPHIEKLEDIVYREVASSEDLGVLSCKACASRIKDGTFLIDNFILVCAPGLREKGLVFTSH
jgi:hypothetical protein